MKYGEFLNGLRDLDHETRARKLEQIDTIRRTRGVSAATALKVSDADKQAETELIADMARGDMPGQIGDGAILREIFTFVKENPLLVFLLMR